MRHYGCPTNNKGLKLNGAYQLLCDIDSNLALIVIGCVSVTLLVSWKLPNTTLRKRKWCWIFAIDCTTNVNLCSAVWTTAYYRLRDSIWTVCWMAVSGWVQN